MWTYQEKTEQACRAARINRLVVNYQINQQLIWFDDRSESIFKKENAKKSRVCSVSVKANWISSWLWTVQDVWGRHRPDSLSINQENNQQCHCRWTEAVIRCCRTWSPHQNITIQTPVMRSDPLMCTQDEQRGADCLKTINNWLLTPSSSTHTSFAITLSVVSLSFVWIRASTYTEKKKKKKKKPTSMCAGSVVTFLPPLRCFHESLISSTSPQSDGSGYKNAGRFSFHGFPTLWPRAAVVYAVQITRYLNTSVGHTHLLVSWFLWPPWQLLCFKELCKARRRWQGW